MWNPHGIDTYGNATIHAWPVGDLDRDGDVDQVDEDWIGTITTADGSATDYPFADIDLDGDVDAADTQIFKECATGPGVPYGPGSLPPSCTLGLDAQNFIEAARSAALELDVRGDGGEAIVPKPMARIAKGKEWARLALPVRSAFGGPRT